MFEPGRPRQSIETLLHAFVPAKHVYHTHPDAVISIACAPDGEKAARDVVRRTDGLCAVHPPRLYAEQVDRAAR